MSVYHFSGEPKHGQEQISDIYFLRTNFTFV